MKMLTLLAVGDIWLRTQEEANPFERIKSALAGKDILFGNLETCLTDSGKGAEKRWVLASPPGHAAYLSDAGFDLFNVANNHTLDRGREGFLSTLQVLEERGLSYVGGAAEQRTQEGKIIEKNGIKLGFLGYTTGRFRRPSGISLFRLDERTIRADIRRLEDHCDHVVLSLHWGMEHVDHPSPGQIALAHRLIDAGATLILGHHSHTVQGIEEYRGGLIAYSMGNFQFDSGWPPGVSNTSMILKVEFDASGIARHEVIPCWIDRNYLPVPAEGKQWRAIDRHIGELSGMVTSGSVSRKWWFEQIAATYLSNNWESYRYRIRNHGIIPLFECCAWTATPFCLQCYAALLRKKIREQGTETR
jgi:poly-gamma-glutamate capsule biosynthesis protein CapA/YwtB (metallophosphatase superfamily)